MPSRGRRQELHNGRKRGRSPACQDGELGNGRKEPRGHASHAMVFVPSSAAEKKTARRGRPWRHRVVHVREEDGVFIVVDAAAKPASGSVPCDDAAGQEVEAPGRGEIGSRGAERRARPAAGLGRGGRGRWG
jgi:hypothetical protein